jgi:NAD(P)-dependent dehydrogenase (short-subunit alcohol dehydrogenase family)
MSEQARLGGRLAGRIALVTGASRGIGAAVAKRFAAEGAQLILLARTESRMEEIDDAIRSASGRSAHLVPLDLCQFDAFDELGASLKERFGRLDILANVAGVGGLHSSLVDVEPEEWAKFLNVNLTASWRLIRSLDPLLRLSEAGRTIFVTSGAVRRIAGYRGPYAVSKAALEMLVKTYAAEIAETRICANLVDPGRVRTQMRAQDRPEEDPMTLTAPEDITEVFVDLAEVNCAKNGEIVLA